MTNLPWATNWEAIDWPVTGTVWAAWVQAIGSVVAIWAVHRIDRRSAERAERQREADARAGERARWAAIRELRASVQLVIDELSGMDFTFGPVAVSGSARQICQAARQAVKHFLNSSTAMPPAVVAALVQASEKSSALEMAMDVFRFANDGERSRQLCVLSEVLAGLPTIPDDA